MTNSSFLQLWGYTKPSSCSSTCFSCVSKCSPDKSSFVGWAYLSGFLSSPRSQLSNSSVLCMLWYFQDVFPIFGPASIHCHQWRTSLNYLVYHDQEVTQRMNNCDLTTWKIAILALFSRGGFVLCLGLFRHKEPHIGQEHICLSRAG